MIFIEILKEEKSSKHFLCLGCCIHLFLYDLSLFGVSTLLPVFRGRIIPISKWLSGKKKGIACLQTREIFHRSIPFHAGAALNCIEGNAKLFLSVIFQTT